MRACSEHNGPSKVGCLSMGTCRVLQPLLAVEFLVANEGGAANPVKAVRPPQRGPQARPYRTCSPPTPPPPPPPPPPPYSATEVDGWQHKLSRVSQNRAAVHA